MINYYANLTATIAYYSVLVQHIHYKIVLTKL